MNLLITNPQEPQAYTILRCLRSEARRVVVTEGGDSVASPGFRGMAAYSRFVDRRYTVPRFSDDWLAGRLGEHNSAAEEQYVQRIEQICEREGIDVIFPSLDPEAYLFSKNKARLAARGIVTAVPEYEVLRVPLDKALTTEAARHVGFPCPRTWSPRSTADVDAICATTEPPWIVKPRFTAHGENMILVKEAAGLKPAYLQVSGMQAEPIVQEFIPGTTMRNYYLTADRGGRILSLLTPEVRRVFIQEHRVRIKTVVSRSDGPYLPQLHALVRELGLWGGYTVQTKIDPRDGLPKLMEINARLGQHIWWRTGLGVNEPRILVQLARGQTPTGNMTFRDGVLMLDAYHDLFYLAQGLTEASFGIGGSLLRPSSASVPDASGNLSLRGALRAYRQEYLSRSPKILCPEVRNLFSDPYPCLRILSHRFGLLLSYVLKRAGRAIRTRISRPQAAASRTG